MTTTVRTSVLEVYIHDGEDWQYDASVYAVSCSFGFDQRYAEATVRRTGGGVVGINYWSPIEIRLGCTPGAGAASRFKGYIIPVENTLYPVDSVLTCKGVLYRAEFVRNTQPGGTLMAPPATGKPDEEQVREILTACGVDLPVPANIGGTGKALGSEVLDPEQALAPSPFTWGEGQAGLDYIEALDAVSVPDDALGRYRTFESLGGEVYRIPLVTVPAGAPDFSFAEGVDVLEARIGRDPAGAANLVTVTGAPNPGRGLVAVDTDVTIAWTARFTAGTGFAPYLPPGLPVPPGTVSEADPEGFPAVTAAFSSQMIEKSTVAETDPLTGLPLGDVLACEAVAQFLLGEYNTVLDTLEFSTPRDDLLGPGQTIHLTSERLALTDPDRHYWLQHLEITLDERGAFTQRLRCLRRS
jgi:hypothetical protein